MEPKEEPAIYIFENKINHKKYVGQTKNAKRRLKNHKNINFQQYIDRAINKYGWEAFEIKIFYVPIERLDYLENKLINNLNTLSPNGYNLDTGGNKNKNLSDEYKRKISESLKGKTKNPTYGFKGYRHSEETKQRIRNSMIGHKISDDTKRKISLAKKTK